MNRTPPPFARFVLRVFAPTQVRDAIDGDLLEEFHRDVNARGRAFAAASYWRSVLRSLPPLATMDISWARAPRIVVAALWGTLALSSFSWWLGLAHVSLPLHIGTVVLGASVAGYGVATVARYGQAPACFLTSLLLVAPAVLSIAEPGAPRALMMGWIVTLPMALMGGGFLRRRRAFP